MKPTCDQTMSFLRKINHQYDLVYKDTVWLTFSLVFYLEITVDFPLHPPPPPHSKSVMPSSANTSCRRHSTYFQQAPPPARLVLFLPGMERIEETGRQTTAQRLLLQTHSSHGNTAPGKSAACVRKQCGLWLPGQWCSPLPRGLSKQGAQH